VKAVILAGGLGSRLSEETYLRPKPMVTIGNRPILWHIMKKFSNHGITQFIVCLGFKGEVVKEYFLNFRAYNSSFSTFTKSGEVEGLETSLDDWKVTLVDTGVGSNTGERLKQVRSYLDSETFFFTYGDGLTDQNLESTLQFHQQSGKLVTLSAVKAPARYGAVTTSLGSVKSFSEHTSSRHGLINGGYFVVNPSIFESLNVLYNPSWEIDLLPELANQGKLGAFEHNGFWFAMDTLRDKEYLERLWETGSVPWLK